MAMMTMMATSLCSLESSKPVDNAAICSFLNELADYERNVSRHIHKYNAYRKASRAIAAFDTP